MSQRAEHAVAAGLALLMLVVVVWAAARSVAIPTVWYDNRDGRCVWVEPPGSCAEVPRLHYRRFAQQPPQ